MEHAKLYHIGCAKCEITARELMDMMLPDAVDIVNLSENPNRLEEAIRCGVKHVPALVTANGVVLHLNRGVDTDAVAAAS